MQIKHLIHFFNQDIQQQTNIWKIKQLKKFNKELSTLNPEQNINTPDDLSHLSGIGTGIKRRIIEYLQRPIPEISITPIEEQLDTIHGIGPIKAKQLKSQGIHNIHDLRKKISTGDIKLTKATLIGVKYWEQLLQSIPQNEITNFKEFLIHNKIFENYKWDICGSYRRQKTHSGDIDLLVSSSDLKSLQPIIKRFKDLHILIDDITPACKKKYMGVGKLHKDGIVRRIDIRLIPPEEYGAALLYFTGSKEFNISMRNRAHEYGYKLNEYGLWNKEERIPETETELGIFKALDLEWRDPKDR